jgi:cytochrome c553
MRINTCAWQGAVGAVTLTSLCGIYVPAADAATAMAPAAAAACQACHGAQGEGMVAGERPRIAGQTAYYLEKQLRDFANGSRESAIMTPIAKTLSDADRSKVAAYFAALRVPAALPGKPPTATQAVRGHQLAIEGTEAERVQACDNCHGPEGSGVSYSAPTLAGQLAPYLATQLKSWQQGTRRNDAGNLMQSVASRLNETDIAAVTSYYASLGSP